MFKGSSKIIQEIKLYSKPNKFVLFKVYLEHSANLRGSHKDLRLMDYITH